MPKNELEKANTNPVALTGGLAVQQQLLNELDKASQDFGVEFTPYGKRCAINAIAGLLMFTKQNGVELKDIDPTVLRLQIQNVGYTELNYASNEIYFDLRKNTVDGKTTYQLAIKPQGAGNEKLVRTYGVGLVKGTGLSRAILVHEGDELILPVYNGETVTPFKYTPKLENANKKVVAVIYIAKKIDKSVEYLYATRDSVKANIIAQIRQNAMYSFKKVTGTYKNKFGKEIEKQELDTEARDAFYEHINKLAESMTVDELLENEEVKEYINPTYTSGGSKEAMIIRKIMNNALKNYPKEYDNSMIAESVRNMWEENDPTVLERKNAKEVIATVDAELDEDLNDDTIEDFDVNEEQKPANEEQQKADEDEDIPF